MMNEDERKRAEIDEVLARSRKLIAESKALFEQVELRQAETDRFLFSQGLTREQVMGMRFTREQRLAVNEELNRRGLPALEEDDGAYDFAAATAELRGEMVASVDGVSDDAIAERQRKFGNFMREIRI